MKTGCCICGCVINKHYTPEGKMYRDKGHNPDPIEINTAGEIIDKDADDYRCCDACYAGVVIPARMMSFFTRDKYTTSSGQVPLMPLEDAVEVVIDLARQGSLSDPDVNEPEEVDAAYQQETAISVVENFFVNNIFDGKE